MSQIRPLEDDDSEDKERRVSQKKDREMLELFVVRTVHQTVHQAIEKTIVPLISSIVKQEFESAREKFLASLKQNSGIGTHSSETRSLQLKFLDEPSVPVFTGTQIKGKDGTPIRVALVDGITGQFVKSGPEASAKVELVVVEGDFDGDKRRNWTPEEFNNKIVREMEGRKSLLSGGHVYVHLNEGIGSIGAVSFTHNAVWMKTREYKLGAKLDNNLSGNRVREAITESFVVKDQRNKWYGKHCPPSQCDEVWRLVKIRRGHPFHKRLSKEKIETVRDFLTQYNINPQWLRDAVALKLVGSALEHMEEVLSFDDEASMRAFLQLSNAAYPSNSPRLVISSDSYFEASDTVEGQPSTSSHANVVSWQSSNAAYPSNLPRLAISADSFLEVSRTDEGQPSTTSHANVVSMHSSNAAYPSNSSRLAISGDESYFEAYHTNGQPNTSCHANVVSLHSSNAACHSNLPRLAISGGDSYFEAYPTNGQPSTSSHANVVSLHSSNAAYHSKSPRLAISSDSYFEASHTDEGQPSISSHTNVVSLHSSNAADPSNSPQWAISGDSYFEASHMDEGQTSTSSHANAVSLHSSNAAYPSNSPSLVISGNSYFEPTRMDEGQPSNSSHANIASLMPSSYPLSDAANQSNFPRLEKLNSFSFEIPTFIEGYVQGSTSTLGISSLISFGSGSYLYDYGLHGDEIEDLINNQPLCFPENLNCAKDGHLQVFDTVHSLQDQNSSLESQGDRRSASAAAAHRSWMMLFLKWKTKFAACKSVSSERIHAPKRPRIS
ncbi:hypothetical protein Acr_00g0019090 [Actinidia rufa]|uniref:Calmodulin-binding protein n=1 Tax=Actinidia rufa TaxID=165716 RepID=A0A7J0DBM9_9ERIC|nr:hypothetical protein Acr_00g0019090 [Actinidia rufa]